MSQDPRCCGSSTCIIDNEGRCWCGQVWDGERMCAANIGKQPEAPTPTPTPEDLTTDAE